jgi:hypothetical protein
MEKRNCGKTPLLFHKLRSYHHPLRVWKIQNQTLEQHHLKKILKFGDNCGVSSRRVTLLCKLLMPETLSCTSKSPVASSLHLKKTNTLLCNVEIEFTHFVISMITYSVFNLSTLCCHSPLFLLPPSFCAMRKLSSLTL